MPGYEETMLANTQALARLTKAIEGLTTAFSDAMLDFELRLTAVEGTKANGTNPQA